MPQRRSRDGQCGGGGAKGGVHHVGYEDVLLPILVDERTGYNGLPTSYRVLVGTNITNYALAVAAACIELLIPAENPPDERLASTYNNAMATMEVVEYKPMCSLARTLRDGGDTAVMVQATFAFVKRLFPWINTVQFTDKSYITCSVRNRDATTFKVSLADISMCKHGQTWYQRVFGARLADPLLRANYEAETARKLLNTPLEAVMREANPSYDLKRDERFRGLEPNDTFTRFMSRLNDATRYDPLSPFCFIVQQWGGVLLEQMLGFDMYTKLRSKRWIIDLSDSNGHIKEPRSIQFSRPTPIIQSPPPGATSLASQRGGDRMVERGSSKSNRNHVNVLSFGLRDGISYRSVGPFRGDE